MQLRKGESVFSAQTHAWRAMTAASISLATKPSAQLRSAWSLEWNPFGARGRKYSRYHEPPVQGGGFFFSLENMKNLMSLGSRTLHSVRAEFHLLGSNFHPKR